MKFLVVAEHDPAIPATNLKPLIIPHILREVVRFAVVPLNLKRRLHTVKRFGKALAEVPIKIER